jgi:hypothetical protein
VVFGALVFKMSVWCGAEGYVSGLRAAAVNCCCAAKGRAGKAEFAEGPTGAPNGGQPQSA